MGVKRRDAFRRGTITFVVWSLVAGTVAVGGGGATPASAAPAGEDGRPGWVDGISKSPDGADVQSIPWEESTSAELPESEGVPASEFSFPEPASWDVNLGDAGRAGAVLDGTLDRAEPAVDDLPIAVAGGDDKLAGRSVRVKVLDRAAAEQVGASGFVFELADADATPRPGTVSPTDRRAPSGSTGADSDATGQEALTNPAGEPAPVELEIDYSSFAEAYGGDYASRLEVVALPACALEDSPPDGCDVAGTDRGRGERPRRRDRPGGRRRPG